MTVLRTLGLYNLIVLFLSSSFNISLQYDCVLLLVESAVSMATGDVLRCCDSGAVVLKLCESIDENAVKICPILCNIFLRNKHYMHI